MNTNLEARALAACVFTHLHRMKFMQAEKSPEYEYALSRIIGAEALATTNDIQSLVTNIKTKCVEQMAYFKRTASDLQAKEDMAESSDDREVLPTAREKPNTEHPLSKKEKARQKQLANSTKQAAALEKKRQEEVASKDVKSTAVVIAVNNVGTAGVPKEGGKPAASGAKKKPTPKKAGATKKQKKQDKDEGILAEATAAAEAAQSEIDAKRQREQLEVAAKKEEKKQIEAEQVLREKGEARYSMLALFHSREEAQAKYIKEHHAEFFSYIQLIIKEDLNRALYMLLVLTKSGYGLDFAEQQVKHYAQSSNVDIQNSYVYVMHCLLHHNRAVDTAVSMVQHLHDKPYLNTEDSKLMYTILLTLLVQHGEKYALAETIINAWIENSNINIQYNLLILLNHLVKRGHILPNISEIIQKFSKFTGNQHIASALSVLQQDLRHYSAKELICMSTEGRDTKTFIAEQYDLLCDFFVEAMNGGSAEQKYDALDVVAILADNKYKMPQAEVAIEKIIEDIRSEFFCKAFYALASLVNNHQAYDLAKRTVIKRAPAILQKYMPRSEDKLGIQINFLSILINRWQDALQQIARDAVVALYDIEDSMLLGNLCELLLELMKAGEAPKKTREIIQELKQAPFDNVKPWVEKLESQLSGKCTP